MKEITMQQCWNDLKTDHEGDLDKTALAMLGIITTGAYAMFDGEKIDRLKSEIISKFNKENDNAR